MITKESQMNILQISVLGKLLYMSRELSITQNAEEYNGIYFPPLLDNIFMQISMS
jgi:hypothetical protein